jgi:transposase-like protein
MIERPLCPECGSELTRKINGPVRYGPWLFHQRHTCLDCGRKFMTEWEGRFMRSYESREMVKARKKSTGQMALPGMTCAS